MAATFRQGVSTTAVLASGATPTLAFTTEATLAGSLLVAVFEVFPTTVTLTSVTDSQNNTWTVLPGTSPGTSFNGYLAYALNTAGGTTPTVTFNLSGSGTVNVACLAEFTGVNSFRAHDTPNTGSTSPMNSGNVTASAGDLLIGYIVLNSGLTTTFAPTSGFSLAESGSASGTNVLQWMIYKLSATAGSQDATATSSSAPAYAFGLAAFFQSAAGGGNSSSGLLKLLGVN